MEEIIKEIEKVISGEIKGYRFPHPVNLYELEERLRKNHSIEFTNVDKNGWQIDYWINYLIDGKDYTLAGGVFDGTQSFSIKESK
jgi:hypothetical protein